jgi:putative transposase
VHPGQIRNWKGTLKRWAVDLLNGNRKTAEDNKEELIQELYRQIGQRKVELDWIKKNLDVSPKDKLSLIEKRNHDISIKRQAELWGIARSTIYYRPIVDPYDRTLMHMIDEKYTRTPFYGSRRMTASLRRDGFKVNRKRVQQLMRLMGIEAIYPKPNLSRPHPNHTIYPYLLKGVGITHRNQVWGTDITYIRLDKGWLYLVAIMDWFSRYVLSWELSTTLEVAFCIDALEKACTFGVPEICNSDQGSQFTSLAFIDTWDKHHVQIRMDGRGRAMDTRFTERRWRSVKYEEVYLKDYRNVSDAKEAIGTYMIFYNHERLHQALSYKTPEELHFSWTSKAGELPEQWYNFTCPFSMLMN